MLTIEKNVPRRGRIGGTKGLRENSKYPFSRMEVNDSIHVDGDNFRDSSAVRSAYAYAKPRGWKFECRSEPGGIRIWRIA